MNLKTISAFTLTLSLLILSSACKKSTGTNPPISQISPANNSVNVSTSQTFTCTPVSGAVSYAFYFNDANTSFSATSATDSVTVPNLSPCDTYTWIVTATKADGSTVATNNWQFTVIGSNLAPCLLQPTNNSTNICVTPSLSWTAIPGTTAYTLYISDNSGFSRSINVSATYYNMPASTLSANDQYFWRVTALGTYTFSPTYTFSTVPPPALSSPANAATALSRTPTFVWSSSGCASSYSIDISTVSDFSSIFKTEQTSNTSYTLPTSSTLSAYTTYYWRVRVNDYTSSSGVFSLTTGL
jgi:hypothetical protein